MEDLIQRAAMALGIGASEDETRKNLISFGYSSDNVHLAIEAAKILNKDREQWDQQHER